MSPAPLIYIIAGEASGDALGAGLMQTLKQQQPDVQFAGIGGTLMEAEGLTSLFPISELSIMGFMEVIPHIPHVLKRLKDTVNDINHKQPVIVITIDSPGFNVRLAKALKQSKATSSIKRVHYVAPSVWAYKPGRAKKMAHLFDALLTLLPFEPPYFEKLGLASTFVGHPVLWNANRGDATSFRRRHCINQDSPVLLVLPGSRMGEIRQHLSLFYAIAKRMLGYTLVFLAPPHLHETLRANLPDDIAIIDNSEKLDAFAAASLALSKSGTITLELAAASVPTVVAHRVSPLSAWLLRRLVLIPYVSLVNIAAGYIIMPEFLQQNCTFSNLLQALYDLSQPQATARQKQEVTEALNILRGTNTTHPNVIAADTVIKLMKA